MNQDLSGLDLPEAEGLLAAIQELQLALDVCDAEYMAEFFERSPRDLDLIPDAHFDVGRSVGFMQAVAQIRWRGDTVGFLTWLEFTLKCVASAISRSPKNASDT